MKGGRIIQTHVKELVCTLRLPEDNQVYFVEEKNYRTHYESPYNQKNNWVYLVPQCVALHSKSVSVAQW